MLGWQDDLKVRLTTRISIRLRVLFPMQTLTGAKVVATSMTQMRVLHAPLLFTFYNVGAKVSASTEKKKKISAMEL